MEAAAALLEAFCAVPNISKLHVQEGAQPGQQMLTVRGDEGGSCGGGMWREGSGVCVEGAAARVGGRTAWATDADGAWG